jgi:hypothetical protein
MKARSYNGYKVSGAKISSRFYFSNKATREYTKLDNAYEQQYYRDGVYKANPQPKLSARQKKSCTHPHMVDDGYGGPDSGCMAGHCPRCGYSFHHTLY